LERHGLACAFLYVDTDAVATGWRPMTRKKTHGGQLMDVVIGKLVPILKLCLDAVNRVRRGLHIDDDCSAIEALHAKICIYTQLMYVQ